MTGVPTTADQLTGRSQQPATGGGLVLADTPGHLIRRAQRVHTALWAQRIGEPTGPQFAVLTAIATGDGLDQSTVGLMASLDKSSTADIVRRLIGSKWIDTSTDPSDARRKLLTLSPPARQALADLTAAARDVQRNLVAPLPPHRVPELIRRLSVVAYEGAPPTAATQTSGRLGLPLPSTPGHLIRRAQQAYTTRWHEKFLGSITGPQYAVLCVIAQYGVLDQGTVGELSSLDKSSVAEVGQRLLQRGLLERVPHQEDRRRKALRLTSDARMQLPALTAAASSVQVALLDLLPESDRNPLLDDLRVLAYR